MGCGQKAGHFQAVIPSFCLYSSGLRSILSTLTTGQIFGEAYALTKEALLVSAVAAEDCSILFVNVAHLYQGAHRDSTWYSKIMKNLLLISSYKNLHLSVRTSQTSFKKIRQRLEAYLSGISITQKVVSSIFLLIDKSSLTTSM